MKVINYGNKMQLWQKITLSLILGTLFGVYAPEYTTYVKPIGDVFLRILKMVIAPLIFFTLVSGITSMTDHSSLGRVALKSTAAYFTTTFFAVLFGIMIAEIVRPGDGTTINFGYETLNQNPSQKFDLANFILNLVPDNALAAIVSGNILQVVFFAIFTGVTINHMGSSANSIRTLFHSFSKMILKMIGLIIQFAPYGAFALTAWVVSVQGLEILVGLSKLVLAIIIAMFFQYLIFGLLIIIFCRISPIPFYKKSVSYQIVAFSTGSSKASLATTMKVCREKLGISESSTAFVLPLGASINMDGFAINLSLTAIFFAQLMGVELATYDYMMIILTATLGSIGGAGIPGASLIMLPLVLTSINLPIEGVAILAGIDRIMDMLRTTINITGDATITLIVDNSEGTLDKDAYYSYD